VADILLDSNFIKVQKGGVIILTVMGRKLMWIEASVNVSIVTHIQLVWLAFQELQVKMLKRHYYP
jgi:hypothetical protein